MRKNVAYIIILVLLIGNVFFVIKYFNLQRGIDQAQAISEQSIQNNQINEDVLEFTEFFIEKVLKTEIKIDIETRLKLENMVKNIGDEEILIQWQKFRKSKTEVEARDNTKDLLQLLVNKIKRSVL